MKRIHFTAEDLARTRVATTIGVAAETIDTVKLLKDRDASLAFRRWHLSVRGRLGQQAGPLAALLPARGPLIDATSLMGDTGSIGTRLLRTNRVRRVDPRGCRKGWHPKAPLQAQ
ncbi:hypothetical protein [Streptomyces sp. NPDC005799]|uniref:hypothetical protein n=1 Tax=Streptomyces sp. NPDC005799 TaxID=3154678 RepID=UPI003409E9F1